MLPKTELKELSYLVRKAGDRILWWYQNKQFVKSAKSDASPVTSADLEAHDILLENLLRLSPGVPVFSEEDLGGDLAKMNERWQSVRQLSEYWLVDPLDGTKGFVDGTGEFSVNVALIVNGRPVIGVMLIPLDGDVFIAISNQAFKQQAFDGDFLSVRSRESNRHAPLVLISSHHGMGERDKILAKIPGAILQPMASAVKYAHIADGRADLSFRYSQTAAWDLAAADAIVHAAGGMISDFGGKPLSYNGPTFFNPGLVACGDPNVPWWQLLTKA